MNNTNPFFFGSLSEFSEKMKQMIFPYNEAMHRFSEFTNKISEAMKPWRDLARELEPKIKKTARIVNSLRRMSDSQFVYWDKLSDNFMDELLLEDNTNKRLRTICLSDKTLFISTPIETIASHDLIQKRYSRLFDQSVSAYNQKNYEISSVGLFATIDGLLSDMSGNFGTSIYKRANKLLERFEETDDTVFDEFENSILALTWTFRETMLSISKKIEFDKREPKNLNRHWTMHGRTRRRKTQLDCIKLIRFIYGLLAIYDYGKKVDCV
jgi:hypothetical protein